MSCRIARTMRKDRLPSASLSHGENGQKPGFETGATLAHAGQIMARREVAAEVKTGFWYFSRESFYYES